MAKFTAMLMLGDQRTGIFVVASRSAATCSGSSPVVATTSGTFCAPHAATMPGTAAGKAVAELVPGTDYHVAYMEQEFKAWLFGRTN